MASSILAGPEAALAERPMIERCTGAGQLSARSMTCKSDEPRQARLVCALTVMYVRRDASRTKRCREGR